MIPVFPDTKLLQFSADSSKLFLQDSTDANMAPSIKVIDTASGNLISLPFAAGLYTSMQLLDADSRIATVQKLPEGYQAQVWQVPGGQKLNPDLLATDLGPFTAVNTIRKRRPSTITKAKSSSAPGIFKIFTHAPLRPIAPHCAPFKHDRDPGH